MLLFSLLHQSCVIVVQVLFSSFVVALRVGFMRPAPYPFSCFIPPVPPIPPITLFLLDNQGDWIAGKIN